MQNKGLIIVLTVVITALCLYYLSFTYVSNGVAKDAVEYATNKDGVVDLSKKQNYLDSIWNIPVYNLFGAEYTYKEVKDNELSLGLDLQGGMHVSLEISPIDIIKGLSANSQDSAFLKALATARTQQVRNQGNFSDLFFKAYRDANPNKRLTSIFANSATKGRIASNDEDSKVIEVVNEEIENAIDRSFTILRNRLDQFGTSQPNIQRLPGTGRIQIEIPGADNPQRVRKLLQGVAKLEFWDVIEPNTLNNSLLAINDILVKEAKAKPSAAATTTDVEPEQKDLSALLGDSTNAPSDTTKTQAEASKGLDSLQNLNISPLFSLSTPPGTFRYDVKDTAKINGIFKRPEIRSLLPRTVGIFWANKPEKDQLGKEALELFFLDIRRDGKAKLDGTVITEARSDLDELAQPAVSMNMNAAGTRIWAKWTAEASSKNPKGRIAIVLDNTVYSAPSVNGEIPNGNSQISGNFTPEEAKDLANVLKAGSLPAPTKIVEEAIIGPTLGEVARSQGMFSVVCGLALVVIFMVGYYGKGGAVANFSLVFNLFFVLGILAQLDAALTLPGIAGIVLTMGMAVDANVIIYERIREELRAGKRLREAIDLGFKRSFWTIFDSNITTFLTALMLYLFGQGAVKGFAITLMVGISTTFFTAVYISHVVIDWMVAKKGDDSNIHFKTFISGFVASEANFDFIGKRKLAYIFSGTVIGIGILLIAIQGFNYGVDFKGGRAYVVTFNNPVDATELKTDLTESFESAGTEVKNFGGNNIVKVVTSYIIDDDAETADDKVKSTLIKGLEKSTGLAFVEDDSKVDDKHFTISSSTKVGANVADDTKAASLQATILSLLAIFMYILIRFRKWQFSAGAVVALAHDALFVIASFAIVRVFGISFEIDQVFIAAILTVIGYSINDTVIIFDRIREYLGLATSHDRAKIFNDAINSTLNRTIITSGTVLLVVIALLFFGGEVLRGFSFALLVGVVVGTYSSIFMAAPIVLDFDKVQTKKTPDVKPEPKRAIA
ncbi:protein translocase subunit SecDF [Chryseolinea sp. H1M3-3]|uniref:protein translocase subunit SecDF n=1 Tax=Chryseolinea sp. H1M3-3 TaxID=3034144 RepID=UPI0023EA833F|nr:protein translocase subunit SecDF [Chryseolinea sp. H1M3-3]